MVVWMMLCVCVLLCVMFSVTVWWVMLCVIVWVVSDVVCDGLSGVVDVCEVEWFILCCFWVLIWFMLYGCTDEQTNGLLYFLSHFFYTAFCIHKMFGLAPWLPIFEIHQIEEFNMWCCNVEVKWQICVMWCSHSPEWDHTILLRQKVHSIPHQ